MKQKVMFAALIALVVMVFVAGTGVTVGLACYVGMYFQNAISPLAGLIGAIVVGFFGLFLTILLEVLLFTMGEMA